MRAAAASLALALWCAPLTVQALDLTLPANARETASRDSVLDQVSVAVGPYLSGRLPTRVVEGPVTRRAYRISSSGLTPLQILAPLRAQLGAAEYEVLLDCNQETCGGFDFRFAVDVLPAPNMYVNLRDFHFLSATDATGERVVTLLASAAAGAGYLQVVVVGEPVAGAVDTTVDLSPDPVPGPVAVLDDPPATQEAPPPPQGAPDLGARLLDKGSVVLRSLDFGLGTTTLSRAESPELAAIAGFMQAHPDLRIAVVGHTDTVGGLDANIAVSLARARAVRSALIDTYGAQAGRIDAEGMGYLAPVASNLTAEGREANRRVEVIVVGKDG